MITTLLVVGTILLWALLTSVQFIKTGTIGAVFLFGHFRRVLRPGFKLIIPLAERTEIYSIQTHQEELPAEPEQIDRVHDIPDPGKKLPFRVPQKGMREAKFYVLKGGVLNPDLSDPQSYEEKNFEDLVRDNPELKTAMEEESLHAPLTSEVAFVFEWNLIDDQKELDNFFSNVNPSQDRDREEEVRKRAEDMISRALQELLSPVTCGHAIERIALFSHMIRERLEILVGEKDSPSVKIPKPWGIHVGDAYIKSIHPGHTVNTARAIAAGAVSEKRKAILKAESDKQTVILNAEGTKQAAILNAEGAKQAVILANDAEADHITRVVKPAAESELTVRAYEAEAYRENEIVTTFAPGAGIMVSSGSK